MNYAMTSGISLIVILCYKRHMLFVETYTVDN